MANESSFYGSTISTFGKPLVGQSVAICSQPANTNTTPCSPLVNTFTDITGSTLTGTPGITTTDNLGNFHFYVPSGIYTIQAYGPQISSPVVQKDTFIPAGISSDNTFTGSTSFTNMNNINNIIFVDGILYPLNATGLQNAINQAVTNGGGEVWVSKPLTINTTITVGTNSPGHIAVVLKIIRPAVITCSVSGTNANDCFQLSSGSAIVGDSFNADPTYAQFQITLGANIAARDIIRPISTDGSSETINGANLVIDANASGGASVVSVINASESFEGSTWQNIGMTNYQGPGGTGACGIKIFTVAAATDGAASIDFNNGWVIPTGTNKWFCIDGTANSAVNMNRIGFRHIMFRANGTSTATMGTITSGVNGQIKNISFYDTHFGAATITGQNILTFNGCFSCSIIMSQFSVQSGTNTGIFLGNTANQQNFGNNFRDLNFPGTWTNLINDVRGPSAGGAGPVNVAFNGAGNTVVQYSQDDGNVTACRFVVNGNCLAPPNVPFGPYNAVFDAAVQSVFNKTLLGAAQYLTNTNCAVNSASPAACGSAAAGAFVVPTTTTAYTVNTTAVTATSRIFLMPRTYAGDLPSTPTCVVPAITAEPVVSGITAGTSFTLTMASTTGQTCWNYWIVN